MQYGILGSGSFATALAKVLTDNHQSIFWGVRNEQIANHIRQKNNNPNYLSAVYFDTKYLQLSVDFNFVVTNCDVVLIAIPSAYIPAAFEVLDKNIFENRKIISAVKGILPEYNLLLNDYLKQAFNVPIENYFTLMGPCHAEEVAQEKLSYLTFSGNDETITRQIADAFTTDYINTNVNDDVYGVQFAAVLKNIYALGAGIAHGLDYGDNFLSVFIANAADEMAGFLKKVGIRNMEVGVHTHVIPGIHKQLKKSANYAASVYLGDLLVTCYSPFSRNRSFGTMIGKGYSVKTAQLEMNMVAEGYNASRCLYEINSNIKSDMPIAETVYKILWENVPAEKGFKKIEETLI